MTTILCISDTHVCHSSPRWAECERILTWFADLAVREADLVIHCGDLYDRTPTVEDESFAQRWVQRIASACPVILVRGNHDKAGALSLLAPLESHHPIHVAEQPEVICEAGVVVQCLPWPRLGELAARSGESGLALEERARAALGDVLRGLASEADKRARSTATDELAFLDAPAPVVLATHALITGAVTSHGQPLVGGELAVGLADLALAGADVVVAGHIHAPQEWRYGGVPMLYCGSPFRTAFGEHETKSVVRLTLGDFDALRVVERIETPAQRMIDVTGRYVQADAREASFLASAHLDYDTLPDVQGHQVRLRYTVPAEHRVEAASFAAAAKAAWLRDGAERVVVEPEVVAVSTARAPEIARATSVRAQLETLWTARGDRPADADAVLLGLAEIEAEVGT